MSLETMKAALAGFIQQVMGRVDYFACYPSTVVSQNEDGTLELKPDARTFGDGPSRVPIRLGVPGVSVKVKPQSRVLLGFEGGDPQRPIATLWEADGLDELTITAQTKVVVVSPNVILGDEDGTEKRVAREGDIVEVVITPNMPIAGIVTGGPTSGGITLTSSLLGIIISASGKVKASD